MNRLAIQKLAKAVIAVECEVFEMYYHWGDAWDKAQAEIAALKELIYELNWSEEMYYLDCYNGIFY